MSQEDDEEEELRRKEVDPAMGMSDPDAIDAILCIPSNICYYALLVLLQSGRGIPARWNDSSKPMANEGMICAYNSILIDALIRRYLSRHESCSAVLLIAVCFHHQFQSARE